MKVKLETSYKDYYTVSVLEQAKNVIQWEKENDDETIEGWAEYAIAEYNKNVKPELYVNDIITVEAYTSRNSRIWDAYGENTGNVDVWITGIAKGFDCFIEFGAYLSDIWQSGAIDFYHHMYIERYVKERS